MRGRHFFGRGFWKWGYPFYTGFYQGPFYFGRGRGNPYPFCRYFPWLPRWWWAYGPTRGYGWVDYGMPAFPAASGYTGKTQTEEKGK